MHTALNRAILLGKDSTKTADFPIKMNIFSEFIHF